LTKNIRLTTFLIPFLLLASCTGILQVEKQSKFPENRNKVREIISINPDFEILLEEENTSEATISRSAIKEEQFNHLLAKNAVKNNILLNVIDTDKIEDVDNLFFKYLAPLKREILQVNYLQDFNEIEELKTLGAKGHFVKKYRDGPEIDSRFAELAEIYGSKYFAVQGISLNIRPRKGDIFLLVTLPPIGVINMLYPDMDTLYYTIVVDVEKSELVYREYRRMGQRASRSNLNSMIYDSFNLINKS